MIPLLLAMLTALFGLAAVPAAEAAPPAQQCALCHRGIEDAHPKKPLTCIQCHRGDGKAPSREKAHAGMWSNPSDLRIVEQTCGTCHTRVARKVKASIMAHRSGTQSGSLFPNGLQPTREGVRFADPEPLLGMSWRGKVVPFVSRARPLQATTVEGARPFTKAEMERIRNAPYKFPTAGPAR